MLRALMMLWRSLRSLWSQPSSAAGRLQDDTTAPKTLPITANGTVVTPPAVTPFAPRPVTAQPRRMSEVYNEKIVPCYAHKVEVLHRNLQRGPPKNFLKLNIDTAAQTLRRSPSLSALDGRHQHKIGELPK